MATTKDSAGLQSVIQSVVRKVDFSTLTNDELATKLYECCTHFGSANISTDPLFEALFATAAKEWRRRFTDPRLADLAGFSDEELQGLIMDMVDDFGPESLKIEEM